MNIDSISVEAFVDSESGKIARFKIVWRRGLLWKMSDLI